MDVNITTTDRAVHMDVEVYDEHKKFEPWVVVNIRYGNGTALKLFCDSIDELTSWMNVMEDARDRLSAAKAHRAYSTLADASGEATTPALSQRLGPVVDRDVEQFIDTSPTAKPGEAIFDIVDGD